MREINLSELPSEAKEFYDDLYGKNNYVVREWESKEFIDFMNEQSGVDE